MGSINPNLTQTRADSCLYLQNQLQAITSIIMPNVKLTYFNLKARGEPCRLLLAYGGIKYEDERIPPPWDPTSTWASLKPTTPLPGTTASSRPRWTRWLTSSRTSSTRGSSSTLPRTRQV